MLVANCNVKNSASPEKPEELITVFNPPPKSDTPLPILQDRQRHHIALLNLCKEQVDIAVRDISSM